MPYLNAWLVVTLMVIAWSAHVVLSVIVASRIPSGARLPMGWGITGKPTWTAPTLIAVSAQPFYAAIGFATLLAPLFFWEMPDVAPWYQAMLGAAVAISFGAHCIHLFFARRHALREYDS